MKKITLATIKSFVKKNQGKIFIKCKNYFDPMTDCVQYDENAEFYLAKNADHCVENTLGLKGVWMVRNGRDLLKQYNDDYYTGYDIYNCCRSFVLAIKK